MMTIQNTIKSIAKVFKKMGGQAYLVGGCVRDKIMKIAPKDYDIEVYGIPAPKIEPALKPFGYVNAMGKSFCIYRVQHPKYKEINVDVSIPRKDSKSGIGHRGFEVTGDPNLSIKEAARRRDITINSILQDPITGKIVDPYHGVQDIKKKIIRATDHKLFGEDPLRVLRICQFAARFGFSIEPKTVKVCKKISKTLNELSEERIGEEWKKLLVKGKKPSFGLKALLELGVAQSIHPEIKALVGVPQEPEWHPEGDVWIHTQLVTDVAAEICYREKYDEDTTYTVMLGALCHDFGKPATTRKDPKTGRIRSKFHSEAGVKPTLSFLRKLRVGEDRIKKVKNIVLEHLNPLFLYKNRHEIKPSTVKRLAVRLFPASFDELLSVAEADYKGRTLPLKGYPAGKWLKSQLKELELKSGGPKPILMGRHLLERGWSPGPEMGRVLRAVFDLQLEGTVHDFETALNHADLLKSKST